MSNCEIELISPFLNLETDSSKMSKENMEIDEDTSRSEENNNGHTMEQIYRKGNEWTLKHFPEVKQSPSHTVLFHLPVRDPSIPPVPYHSPAKWDDKHVRLPYAPQNQYVVRSDDNSEEVRDRWSLIKTALTKDIRTSYDLEDCILSYNTKYCQTWKFRGLHKLFQDIDETDCESFFAEILPGIIRLALALPELVPGAIPLLKRGSTKSVSFSQQQIASLLANAFLCTFPRRNAQGKRSEYRSFPDINFNRLFQSSEPNVIEKLKCICNYFRRVSRNMPTGVVTFTRRCMPDKQRIRWDKWGGDFELTKLHVTAYGTIEDQGRGLLQVDFANKFLGGGVLGNGCVQEEIRFVICPEMIVSKLITEVLDKNESLFMIGCERFSDYNGYAASFEFNGNFNDDTPYDESRRKLCNVVAIDALNFYTASDQYKEELIRRELDKAYVGYYHELNTPAPGLATGNWGCGAFGGNKLLKALIQLMVCCVTCRPMVYFTFCDKDLRDELLEMHKFLVADKITVAELWTSIVQIRNHKVAPDQIYSFIYQWHRDIKQSRLLLDDSPNFNRNNFPTDTSTQKPSSSCELSDNQKWQWPSQKNQSIPSSSFYSKLNCDTSSKIEKSLQAQNTSEADLIRKSRSNLLDATDREHYAKQLAKISPKQIVTGASSLLNALDEDYGVRNSTTFTEKINSTTTKDQSDPIEDIYAGDSDGRNQNRDELVDKEHSEDEDVIPCTPPPIEKTLKRKAVIDKKQTKLTDIYPKLNTHPNQ